jgi:hypothetical protein
MAGSSPDHCCFELAIDGDSRRYVGYHRVGSTLSARPGSSLAAFLRDGAQPITGTLPTLALTKSEAVAMVAARRRQARSEGYIMVHNHTFANDRRPIAIGPYSSIREAARQLGIGRNVLARRIAAGLPLPGTTAAIALQPRDSRRSSQIE